jgi:myo-inositol 2-dehydrogenase/D-chiro-inositol 1-dehydrogenase
LPALRTVAEIEVVALADLDPNRLQSAGDRFGISHRYRDAAALLADPAVDAVAVCVPVRHHVEVARAVLEARKHLFLEKPLALSLAESDRLIDAAAGSSLTIQMGFNLRWHRLVREARARLEEGTLGRIVAVRSTLTSDVRFHRDVPDWRKRRSDGGGEFFETAIHHFDLWRFLFDTTIEEIFAHSCSNDWDDETTVVSARLANGALASAMFSITTAGSSELEIYGEKGRLSLSFFRFDGLELTETTTPVGDVCSRLRKLAQTVTMLPWATLRARSGGDFLDSYRLGWRNFADCARRSAPASCTLDDGQHALRAVLAAVASVDLRRPVSIDHVRDMGN